MRKGKTYIVPHRRRRKGLTDFRARLRLLKSGKPRLVVRKGSNSLVCQIVNYEKGGDKTLVTANSRDLVKMGWKGHPGNTTSAYLVGLLCGRKALEKKVKGAILDTGFNVSTKGSGLYAALKGALDAGLEVPHSPEVLPSEERIKGLHISGYREKLKTLYPRQFEEMKARISGRKEKVKGSEKKAIKTSGTKKKKK